MIAGIIAMTVVNPSALLSVAVNSASESLKTALSLTGIYCLWLGIFNIMEQCGLVGKLAKASSFITKKLYGGISEAAASYIAINMSANLIGVSNAATPSAIKAIAETERDNVKLSRAGVMLFVVNATSIQIIPSTVMGLRASMGSANPSDIMLPTLISTVITTVLGVGLVFFVYGKADGSGGIRTAAKKR